MKIKKVRKKIKKNYKFSENNEKEKNLPAQQQFQNHQHLCYYHVYHCVKCCYPNHRPVRE